MANKDIIRAAFIEKARQKFKDKKRLLEYIYRDKA